MWCKLDDHSIFQSIHSAKYPFFYPSFSLNQPGAKWLVWNGIKINFLPEPAVTTFAFPSV